MSRYNLRGMSLETLPHTLDDARAESVSAQRSVPANSGSQELSSFSMPDVRGALNEDEHQKTSVCDTAVLPQVPLVQPCDEEHLPTEGRDIVLREGYTLWCVTIEHPSFMHLNRRERQECPELLKVAQWHLSYTHGQFPAHSQTDTLITFQGQTYLLLRAGSNSLRVQAQTSELFATESAQRACDIAALQQTPARQEHLSRRRDNRKRTRGHRHMGEDVSLPQQQEQAPFCYTLTVRMLPRTLCDALPSWARGGFVTSLGMCEEPTSLGRSCYVQLFTRQSDSRELVVWHPYAASPQVEQLVPECCRVVLDPRDFTHAPLLSLTTDEALRLMRQLEASEQASLETFVAPASFLEEDMRVFIAPSLSNLPSTYRPEAEPQRGRTPQQGGSKRIAIPQEIAHASIAALNLTQATIEALKDARLMRVGQILEVSEQELPQYFLSSEEHLRELYQALLDFHALPTALAADNRESAPRRESPQCNSEVFYYHMMGTTFDDPVRGRLYLAYATSLVGRLTGHTSGAVQTVWLTQEQVRQSLTWERSLASLDSFTLNEHVANEALARGADFSSLSVPLEVSREIDEERYNMVPLRDPRSGDDAPSPLYLFISNEDAWAYQASHLSPTAIVLNVLKRYLMYPESMPPEAKLDTQMLEEMAEALREDQQQVRLLNTWWKGRHKIMPSDRRRFVLHNAYQGEPYPIFDEKTGQRVIPNPHRQIGFWLIVGLLATSPVATPDFVLKPQQAHSHVEHPASSEARQQDKTRATRGNGTNRCDTDARD